MSTSFNATPNALFKLRLQRDALRVKSLSLLAALSAKDFSSSLSSGLAQVFDPSKSSSFATLSCDSTLCRQLDSRGCNNHNKCLYQVSYGDGSFTIGQFSTETLEFRKTSINSVAFGCGHDNEGLSTGAAGLLGLGKGKLSFPGQAKPLIGISVGGTKVPAITPELFKLDAEGNGGVIVDSGTSVTRLTRPGYVAVSDAFRLGTKDLKRAPDFSLFDTCFDLSGKAKVKVPTVVLHFAGADVAVPAANYRIPVFGEGRYCFGFAGRDGAYHNPPVGKPTL
ncbi:hypothetical protein BC332_12722 [Capsicum chinense]|nr:hypothetical protein BC332_12722 [Capsicum chinense]